MQHFLKISSVLLFTLYYGVGALAQQLSGTVIEAHTFETIPTTHVINKSTLKGTLSDDDGKFVIDLKWGDTIVFSNIAYKYFYFIYSDSTTSLKNVVIKMEEQNYLLNEVSVFSYKLTSNDDKAIEIRKPAVPDNSELSDGRIVRADLSSPAELLYNLFGSKPRQLRMLAQLKAEDAYREKLEESNNRSSVVQLTGLSQTELEAFMFYCKFAPVRMQTLNDYEFLISVQQCYRQYVKEQEMESFLEQFD
jgi:hypothetical protein